MTSDLFIGIVSGKPVGLSVLPSATYRFMDRMVSWANDIGYESWLFSDEDETGPDLTGKYIAEYIEEKNSAIVEHPDAPHGLYNRRCIFVYFCGHGFSRSKYEQFWILQQGKSNYADRIDALEMQEIIELYSPEYVRMFGDACAEPKYLTGGGGPVFPVPNQVNASDNVKMDLFFASSKGEITLADQNGPLFSQVVAKAMFDEPIPDAVLDPVFTQHTGQPTITNQSLESFITPRFENLVAQKNGVAKPWIIPSVGYTGNIYRQEKPENPPTEAPDPIDSNLEGGSASSLLDMLAEYNGIRELSDSQEGGFSAGTLLFAPEGVETDTIFLNNVEPERMVSANPYQSHKILNWKNETQTKQNGASLLKYQSSSRIMPFFESYVSVVSSGQIDVGGPEVRLEGVKPTIGEQSGFLMFGAALLNGLVYGNGNWRTLKPFVDMAWNNLLEDPLASIALSYYFDALRDHAAMKIMMELLVGNRKSIPIEVPLFAGVPVEYDVESRSLKASGATLSTQLPILSRGWSRLFARNSTGIFKELISLKNNIGAHAYASFEREEDQALVSTWLERYFSEETGDYRAYEYQQ